MAELVDDGGGSCSTNQILYNLARRGPEFDLLPWHAAHKIPVMAYSPVEQGRLPQTAALADVGRRHGLSPLQVALAWVAQRPGVLAIPKAASIDHVRQNRAAADIVLPPEDLAALDQVFPPPRRKQPLAML